MELLEGLEDGTLLGNDAGMRFGMTVGSKVPSKIYAVVILGLYPELLHWHRARNKSSQFRNHGLSCNFPRSFPECLVHPFYQRSQTSCVPPSCMIGLLEEGLENGTLLGNDT
jgi:hypothetical protein